MPGLWSFRQLYRAQPRRRSEITLLVGGRSLAKAQASSPPFGPFIPPKPMQSTSMATCLRHSRGSLPMWSFTRAAHSRARIIGSPAPASPRAAIISISPTHALSLQRSAASTRRPRPATWWSSVVRVRVPCLTAAIVDAYLPCFARLDAVDYGTSTAQHANRGVATASAVLSYVGKPMTMLRDGRMKSVYGFEDTHAEHYPELGGRLFSNCDIPDLTLFPARYRRCGRCALARGTSSSCFILGTRALGALVRLGFITSLDRHALFLLRLASLFDPLGSGRSGFHMILAGTGHDGRAKTRRFHLIARSGHGRYIPCIPRLCCRDSSPEDDWRCAAPRLVST
jgi:hypothetical protein